MGRGRALSTAMSRITRHQELKVCKSTRYILNANRIRCIIIHHDDPIARNHHAIVGGVQFTKPSNAAGSSSISVFYTTPAYANQNSARPI